MAEKTGWVRRYSDGDYVQDYFKKQIAGPLETARVHATQADAEQMYQAIGMGKPVQVALDENGRPERIIE